MTTVHLTSLPVDGESAITPDWSTSENLMESCGPCSFGEGRLHVLSSATSQKVTEAIAAFFPAELRNIEVFATNFSDRFFCSLRTQQEKATIGIYSFNITDLSVFFVATDMAGFAEQLNADADFLVEEACYQNWLAGGGELPPVGHVVSSRRTRGALAYDGMKWAVTPVVDAVRRSLGHFEHHGPSKVKWSAARRDPLLMPSTDIFNHQQAVYDSQQLGAPQYKKT